ncbi:NAD-dependent epimerase/dehydratase family protein [Gordonia sp. MP11Mi]|uniref:NAD-dependent epimerase/dehydratase domain-containing protein n=1 Tax=Gordonia sp. MP11Mi TaxID=3022769 RepID=A0AA97GXS5_9ACTN
MNIFITGGTGLVGSAVVAELIAHDHAVTALARSDASAAVATAAGASVVRGALGDIETLRSAASAADGVIHLAFSNDFSSPQSVAAAVQEEAAALDALARQLVGTYRPIVTVSGTPYAPGRASLESDPLPTDGPVAGRGATVNRVLDLAADGVRSSAVRLPRTVHNHGKGGFTGILTESARASGVVRYPGDGNQRWPAVHALDAAVLIRLALQEAPGGTSWHAVADEGVAVGDMAEVIGRRLGLPVEIAPEEVFGPLGQVFAIDQLASSVHTRSALGWQPTHAGLLEDLELIEP